MLSISGGIFFLVRGIRTGTQGSFSLPARVSSSPVSRDWPKAGAARDRRRAPKRTNVLDRVGAVCAPSSGGPGSASGTKIRAPAFCDAGVDRAMRAHSGAPDAPVPGCIFRLAAPPRFAGIVLWRKSLCVGLSGTRIRGGILHLARKKSTGGGSVPLLPPTRSDHALAGGNGGVPGGIFARYPVAGPLSGAMESYR